MVIDGVRESIVYPPLIEMVLIVDENELCEGSVLLTVNLAMGLVKSVTGVEVTH